LGQCISRSTNNLSLKNCKKYLSLQFQTYKKYREISSYKGKGWEITSNDSIWWMQINNVRGPCIKNETKLAI